MADTPTQTRFVDFDSHRLAYRAAGEGPAIVVLRNDRLRRDFAQARLLRGSRRVVEVYPLGYGRSDRPPDHPVETMPDQVHAVADALGVERFVIWGYSQCAAMAACVAQASTRTLALIGGGLSLTNSISPGAVRRMDRVLPAGHASRPFWKWFASFDWGAELATMPFPRLFYAGTEDTYGKKLRRARLQLEATGVDIIEFEGLTHRTCTDPPADGAIVVPAVTQWLDRRIGSDW
jgi:pimeloyl-ACP methyl ester carboxylesterase